MKDAHRTAQNGVKSPCRIKMCWRSFDWLDAVKVAFLCEM